MASLLAKDEIITDVNPARILVIGRPEVLQLVESALARYSDLFNIEACGTLQAALEQIRGGTHDVALLELDLPDSWPADTYKRFLGEAEDVPVLVLGRIEEAGLAAQGAPVPPFSVLDPAGPDDIRRLIASACLFNRGAGKRHSSRRAAASS